MLSLQAIGFVVARSAYLEWPTLGIIAAASVVTLAAWALVLSRRRYHDSADRLSCHKPTANGVASLAVCLMTTPVGLTFAWLVVATQ